MQLFGCFGDIVEGIDMDLGELVVWLVGDVCFQWFNYGVWVIVGQYGDDCVVVFFQEVERIFYFGESGKF